MQIRKKGVYTLTLSQIEKLKKDATEAAIQELLRRNKETLEATSEDVHELLLLTGVKALINLGCDVDFVYAYIDEVADIQCSLNEGVTMDSLEKEVVEFGIQLVKEKL